MRLVFLVTEDRYFVSHRLPLARAAQQAGHKVIVITRVHGHDAIRDIRAAGIEVIPFELARRGLNPIGLIREILGIARLYRRLRPDLVHHVALRPVVVGGIAARLARVKHIISALTGMGYVFTGDCASLLRTVVRFLLRLALRRGSVIVQNPDDEALVAMLGVATARIRLIRGSGVDTFHFQPRPEPQGLPVVMFGVTPVSWTVHETGVTPLIQVASIVALYLLGSGLGLGAPLFDYFALVPAVMLITMLPISIAGWGVREGAMLVAFHYLGAPPERIVLTSVYFGLATLALSLTGGVIWMSHATRGRPE